MNLLGKISLAAVQIAGEAVAAAQEQGSAS
jgi:hypothetical protein